MAQACRKLTPAPDERPTAWRTVDDVAECLRLSRRRVQERCEWTWRAQGLARKIKGKWAISPNADPRLLGTEVESVRDTRQIGEMTAAGVPEKFIQLAVKRRQIVIGFARFSGHTRADKARRGEYINSIASNGVIPCDGISHIAERTLRRWCELYAKSGDAGGIRALTDRVHPQRNSTAIGDDAWAFFLEVTHCGTGIKIAAAYEQTHGYILEKRLTDTRGWAWPSLRKVYVEYAKRVSYPVQVRANQGERRFEAKCIPKIHRSYADVAAGDMLVGDERVFDFRAVAPGERGPRRVRLKITAWLDTRSRVFVGWHIAERANSDTILSSFKSACLAMKTIPIGVYLDNGEDYKAVGGPSRRSRKWSEYDTTRIQGAFEGLGIETTYAQKYHPWAKMIESHFNAVKNGFDRFIPSFVGGSPDERPWDSERWERANLDKLPTVVEAREAFAEFLAAHHETPQRGDSMDGLSPRQAMRQFFTTEPRYAGEDALRLLCCRRIRKKVGRDGIRLDGINYGAFDEKVFRMQGEEVWVAIDPVVGDRVTLCRKDGTPICEAGAYKLAGATREDIRDAIAFQRRCKKIVREELPPARRYLLQNRPAQIAHRKRLAAQARQIPDSQLPTPPSPTTVQVVRPDVEAGVEKLRKAAGSADVERLAGLNPGAKALNAGHRRRVNFAQFANDEVDPPPAPRGRPPIDWENFPNADAEGDE